MLNKKLPPIAQLRKICQSEKLAKDKRFWYTCSRKLSIYLTWLLLHTGVSANQVTIVTVFLSVLAALLLACPHAWVALCGVFVFVVYHFLDKVDGEIARYYQKFSISGVFLDEVGHTISFAGIFAGLGFHLAQQVSEGVIAIFAYAIIGAISMVMIRQNKSMGCLLFAQYVLVNPRLLPVSDECTRGSILTREGTHEDRRDKLEGCTGTNKSKTLSLVRDTVLVVSQCLVMLLFVFIGLLIEVISGKIIFLVILIKVAAGMQLLILFALMFINFKVNIAAECLRLRELIRKKHGNFDK